MTNLELVLENFRQKYNITPEEEKVLSEEITATVNQEKEQLLKRVEYTEEAVLFLMDTGGMQHV